MPPRIAAVAGRPIFMGNETFGALRVPKVFLFLSVQILKILELMGQSVHKYSMYK